MNLSKQMKLVLVKAQAASAGTTVATDSVNLHGYDSAIFFGKMATVAGNSVKLQISEDGAAWVDLVESMVVPTADGNCWAIDVNRPTGGTFARAEIDRGGTNTALGDTYAILYNARDIPVPQPATLDLTFVNAPEPVEP